MEMEKMLARQREIEAEQEEQRRLMIEQREVRCVPSSPPFPPPPHNHPSLFTSTPHLTPSPHLSSALKQMSLGVYLSMMKLVAQNFITIHLQKQMKFAHGLTNFMLELGAVSLDHDCHCI